MCKGWNCATLLSMKKRATAGQKRGARATKAKALEFALSLRGKVDEHLEWGASLNQIAQEFNDEGVPSPRGGRWTAKSVSNLVKCLEQLPPAPVSQEQLNAEKQKREQQRAKLAALLKDECLALPITAKRRRETGGQLELDDESDLDGLAPEELDEMIKHHRALEADARKFGPPKPHGWTMVELEFERKEKEAKAAARREALEERQRRKEQQKAG